MSEVDDDNYSISSESSDSSVSVINDKKSGKQNILFDDEIEINNDENSDNESDDENNDEELDKNIKKENNNEEEEDDDEFSNIDFNSDEEDIDLDNDDEDDDNKSDDLDEENEKISGGAPVSRAKQNKTKEKTQKKNKISEMDNKIQIDSQIDDSDNDSDNEDENYLQKFNSEITKNYITEFHPECYNHNYDEIAALSKVTRDQYNIIIDPLHKTIPYLTKYEKARILGQRAKQIECGAKPLVKVPENIIDSYLIAELELQQKRIPFIIRRPLPNGGSEYWNLKDLEVITF